MAALATHTSPLRQEQEMIDPLMDRREMSANFVLREATSAAVIEKAGDDKRTPATCFLEQHMQPRCCGLR